MTAQRESDPRPNLAETSAPDFAPDPFRPENLKLSQSFAETVGVRKLLTTVPVRKPSPQDFVRVRPEPEFRENFPVIELKDEREEYIVTADLVPELTGEFVTKALFTAINRQATVFFWPVRLPSPDGKNLDWDSEFEALPGERQVPVCLAAHELRSGRRFRLWQDELLRLKAPPYATGRDVLFFGFYVSAELHCYRVLDWPMPERVLDLSLSFGTTRTAFRRPPERACSAL